MTIRPDAMEAEFQRWLIATAKAHGYEVQVALRMMRRGSNSQPGGGWPDLMFVGHGRIFWAELKAGKNDLYDNQRRIIDLIRRSGGTVFVWWPKDAEAILTVLAL